MPRFHQVDFMQSSPHDQTVNVRAFDDDADGQEVGNCIVQMDWWGGRVQTLGLYGRIHEDKAHDLARRWARGMRRDDMPRHRLPANAQWKTAGMGFHSREAFQKTFKAVMQANGWKIIDAEYNDGGNCLTCGEAGRCPGSHIKTEGAA